MPACCWLWRWSRPCSSSECVGSSSVSPVTSNMTYATTCLLTSCGSPSATTLAPARDSLGVRGAKAESGATVRLDLGGDHSLRPLRCLSQRFHGGDCEGEQICGRASSPGKQGRKGALHGLGCPFQIRALHRVPMGAPRTGLYNVAIRSLRGQPEYFLAGRLRHSFGGGGESLSGHARRQ
jgi:hypothetical protein